METEISKSRLQEIAEIVNDEHAKIEGALREGLTRALEVGKLLTEAKELVKHGGWLQWIADNCQFSERTAQNYMRLAERYPELSKSATVADLTYREAVGLLAEPKQEALSDTTFSDWLTRVEWANAEIAQIEALKTEIKRGEFIQENKVASPALKMLEVTQELVKQEEIQSRFEKYCKVMRGAMVDAAQDEIFPMLESELRQKVNDWIEFTSTGVTR